MTNHFSGGKISRSHTTVIDAAKKLIATAAKLSEVSKISLGVITPNLPTGRHRLKCINIAGGIRAEVRGTNSKQQIFIYTQDAVKTETALMDLFPDV